MAAAEGGVAEEAESRWPGEAKVDEMQHSDPGDKKERRRKGQDGTNGSQGPPLAARLMAG